MPLPVEVVPRCWVEVLFSCVVEVVLLARRVLSVAVCVLLLERPLPEVELPVVARDELLEVLELLLVVLVAREEVLEEDEVVARDEVPLLLELLVEALVLEAREEVLLPVVVEAREEVLLPLVVEARCEEVLVVEPVVVVALEEVPVELAVVEAFCWVDWV